MRLIDFGARKIPADDIKAAGYDGVVVYVSDSQPGANFGAKPITREYADALRVAGLHIISNFQCGKPGGAAPSDFTRGFDGGIEDARTALRLHKAAGGPDSTPIIFSSSVSIKTSTSTPGTLLRSSGFGESTPYSASSAPAYTGTPVCVRGRSEMVWSGTRQLLGGAGSGRPERGHMVKANPRPWCIKT